MRRRPSVEDQGFTAADGGLLKADQGLLAIRRRWSVEDEWFLTKKRYSSGVDESLSAADDTFLLMSNGLLMTMKSSPGADGLVSRLAAAGFSRHFASHIDDLATAQRNAQKPKGRKMTTPALVC